MKIQKSTLILFIIAVLLGGGVYLYEAIGKPQQEKVQTQQQKLFTFKGEDVQKITLEKPKETLEFERTGDPNKPWKMKKPKAITANEAAVSFLLTLLVDRERDRSFTASVNQLKDYGLNPPLATIKIQLNNQQTHKLILGNANLSGDYIYAQIDPPSESQKDLEIVLVPKELGFGVERELTEWQQPEEIKEPNPKDQDK